MIEPLLLSAGPEEEARGIDVEMKCRAWWKLPTAPGTACADALAPSLSSTAVTETGCLESIPLPEQHRFDSSIDVDYYLVLIEPPNDDALSTWCSLTRSESLNLHHSIDVALTI